LNSKLVKPCHEQLNNFEKSEVIFCVHQKDFEFVQQNDICREHFFKGDNFGTFLYYLLVFSGNPEL